MKICIAHTYTHIYVICGFICMKSSLGYCGFKTCVLVSVVETADYLIDLLQVISCHQVFSVPHCSDTQWDLDNSAGENWRQALSEFSVRLCPFFFLCVGSSIALAFVLSLSSCFATHHCDPVPHAHLQGTRGPAQVSTWLFHCLVQC